jgi:hypothetical protein
VDRNFFVDSRNQHRDREIEAEDELKTKWQHSPGGQRVSFLPHLYELQMINDKWNRTNEINLWRRAAPRAATASLPHKKEHLAGAVLTDWIHCLEEGSERLFYSQLASYETKRPWSFAQINSSQLIVDEIIHHRLNSCFLSSPLGATATASDSELFCQDVCSISCTFV